MYRSSVTFDWVSDASTAGEEETGTEEHETSTEGMLDGQGGKVTVLVVFGDAILTQKLDCPLGETFKSLKIKIILLYKI